MALRKIIVSMVRSIGFALLLFGALAVRSLAAPAAKLVVVAPRAFAGQQPLLGYLTRPVGKGRFPAVALLHGCGGFGPRETHWADRLRQWGYVALAVDSFTPRNQTGCNGPTADTGVDGFAALHYLATLPFVLPDRVAVLGSSLGGIAALNDVEGSALEPGQHLAFRAAVAFYPSCTGDSGRVDVPTLILIGDADDWAWAQACRDMVADASKRGSPIRLVVFPHATHDFDSPAAAPYQILGHHIAYDAAATHAAEQRVRDFLHEVLRQGSGGVAAGQAR